MIQTSRRVVVLNRRATVKIVPLSCNHCGAPLSVPESTRFVTCGHCHSQLAIHHDGAAVFTEVLGEIAARTANIEQHLAEMQMEKDLERIEKDLARVDAAWDKERKEILVGGEKGAPAKGMVWLTSFLFMVVGTAIFLPMVGGRRAISPWALLIPVTVPWVMGWVVAMQVDRYEESEGFYKRIRQAIQSRRGRLKRSARTGASLEAGRLK